MKNIISENLSIAIITNSLALGGAEQQSLYLSKVLKDVYPTYLIVYHGDIIDIKHQIFINNEDLHVLLLKGNIVNKIFTIVKFFKKNNIEIVFSYLLLGNLVSGICGKIAGVKKIYGGIRSSKFSLKMIFIQAVIHRLFHTGTITNNNSVIPLLIKRGFKKAKIIYIPNCIPIKKIKRIVKNHIIKIITVSRFDESKDYLTAIKSIHMVLQIKENLKFKYYIIGYGKLEKKILEWINEYDLRSYIEIIIKPVNLEKLLMQSDIYLCTSKYEGLSNSIMEALEFNLPVIATDVGDNKELVIDGKNGFLARVGAVDDITVKLIKLIEDDKLRVQMGLNSYSHLKENFSMHRFKQSYIELIEK